MSVHTFQKYISDNAIPITILETTITTRSAEEAAQVHGVPVGSIVKSLLLKVDESFILYLTPGDIRLNIEEVQSDLQASNIRMATAEEVKSVTGYSIGGVPPIGHKTKIPTYIHKKFSNDYPLFASAGSAFANFKTTLAELKKLVE